MKTRAGDLLQLALDGEFDVIVHGCNCFCTMGAGIAKAVKAKFPEAFEADKITPKGDRSKLGSYSQATIVRGATSFIVVNAYTQFNWRGKGVLIDYEAIRGAFQSISHEFAGRRIGYPLIGAGLAGGDWSRISSIIDDSLAGLDHTLVQFEGP